jgi:hypothetical protein
VRCYLGVIRLGAPAKFEGPGDGWNRPRVWPNWKELDMPNIVLVAAAVVAMVVTAPGTAGADPDPTPGPYHIPTPSWPVLPGVQTYPPTCLRGAEAICATRVML